MPTDTETKSLLIQFNLDQCLRSIRADKKRVLTVALVTERIDRFKTIINPEGCITDFSNVVVDFRHSRISTGAKLTNKRIEDVTLDTSEKVRALVGDIEVFHDSMLRLRDANGRTFEDGNAFEAVSNGRIMSVSVDFEPVETWANEETGIIEYRKWSLRCLSLLDTISGQEDSMILNVRSLNNQNNNNMNMYKIGDKCRLVMEAEVTDVTENNGKTTYRIKTNSGYEVDMTEEQCREFTKLVVESSDDVNKELDQKDLEKGDKETEMNRSETSTLTIDDVKAAIQQALTPLIEMLNKDVDEDTKKQEQLEVAESTELEKTQEELEDEADAAQIRSINYNIKSNSDEMQLSKLTELVSQCADVVSEEKRKQLFKLNDYLKKAAMSRYLRK